MKLTLSNLIGRYFATGEDYKKSEKPLNYIVASNGTFEQRINQLGSFYIKREGIPNLDNIEEGIHLNIPKIPFDIFNKMIIWFRAIYTKDRTESTFMLFYNEKNGFIPFIPVQENSSANSKYLRDEDPDYTAMCKDNALVMVAHSHPWKGTSAPGPSATDNADEKEAILYLIANNVEDVPNVYCSTCPGGKRIKLNFFDIFQNPFLERTDIPEDVVPYLKNALSEKELFGMYIDKKTTTVPLDWIKKHKTKTYTPVQIGFANYGGYQTYGGYRKEKSKKDLEKEDEMSKKIDAFYSKYNSAIDYEDVDDYYGYGADYEYYDFPSSKPSLDLENDEDDYDGDLMLSDAIDLTLDLSTAGKAELILTLIDEGHEALINACLKESIVPKGKKTVSKKGGKK